MRANSAVRGMTGAPYRGYRYVARQGWGRASRNYQSAAISRTRTTQASDFLQNHVPQSQPGFYPQSVSASIDSSIYPLPQAPSTQIFPPVKERCISSPQPPDVQFPEDQILNREVVCGLLREADTILDNAPAARKRLPFIAAQLEMELDSISRIPAGMNSDVQRQCLILQYQCDAFKGVLTPPRATPLLSAENHTSRQQKLNNTLLSALKRAYKAHVLFGIPFHQRILPLLQNWSWFGRFVLDEFDLSTDAEAFQATQLYTMALVDARQSFHQLEKVLLQGGKQGREDISRTSYICLRSLCVRGRSLDGLRLYQIVIRDGIPIPPFIVGKLALALIQDGRSHEAGPLLDPLCLKKADRYVTAELEAALALAAATGNHKRARLVYEVLRRRTPQNGHHVVWLFQAYAKAGRVEDAINAFEETFGDPSSQRVPSLVHFTPIIQAIASHGTVDQVEDWLAYMRRLGYKPDIAIFNVILSSLAHRGDVRSVDTALRLMASQHIPHSLATCTILVSLYASRQETELGDQVVLRAIQAGLKPDARLLSSLIRLHVEVRDWEGAAQVVQYLGTLSPPIFTDGELFDALLEANVKSGAPFEASRRVFRSAMPKKGIRPSSRTYNLMIQAACKANLMHVANRFFAELSSRARKQGSGLKLDGATFATMIAGYLRSGQYRLAIGTYNSMRKSGIPATSAVVRNVLELCIAQNRRSSLNEAEEFLGRVSADHPGNTALLSEKAILPLIRAYATRGRDQDVERHVGALYKDEGSVGPTTLIILLDGYRHSQNLAAMRSVWKHIVQISFGDAHMLRIEKPAARSGERIDHILAALSICISGLSSGCAHEEVQEVWDQVTSLGVEPDATCWNSLIGALIRGGQSEKAFDILEHVLLRPSRNALHRTLHPTGPRITGKLPLATRGARDSIEQTISSDRRAKGQRSTIVGPLPSGGVPPVPEQASRPSAPDWRPSRSTLATLHATLRTLQTGSMIRAVQPGPAKPVLTHYDPINASIVLERIRQNAPAAVAAVLAFDAKQC